jgi:hypothetical protein
MRHGTTTTSEAILYPPSADQAHLIPAMPTRDPGALGPAGDDFSPLLHIALVWLREDKKIRMEEEAKDGSLRKRGARKGNETTDSE